MAFFYTKDMTDVMGILALTSLDESLSWRDSVRFGTLCFIIMKLGADVIHEQFEISLGDIHFKGVYF